ncbi:MAG: Rrf2 family transcriptional regulator [Deltaproteobacteria bacterium]|nr:Rrf2 family transcriptional regulator [Deltaproteobacteria bacterium]
MRAMVYLATRSSPSCEMFHACDISQTQDIPPHYLKQILSRLRSAGLVRSTRGPAGGHALARPASEISLGEVIGCLEGELTGVEGILAMPCAIDVGPSHCVIKEFLLEMKRRVEELLNSTTLADLAARQTELSKGQILVRPRILVEAEALERRASMMADTCP